MPTLLSSQAPEVVIMTTPGATTDNKVGIMKIPAFQCVILWVSMWFLTGLWPESSGMVDNFMYDGEKDATFWLGERSSDYEPFWWKDAEPIWISATKQVNLNHSEHVT